MTKKPAFWVLLALVSLASAAFSWRYFTSAFPLLSLDIGMDRQAALDSARALATERRLGPTDFRDAASFSIDESVQTFVELEGGGKPAFNELVKDRLYTPYRWRVRHFKEGEKHEAMFTFAPDGTPNGFVERLREDAPGAALSPDQARTIAEATAARPWRVDLTVFKAVEQSQERRTSGRIDYTFAYERPDRQLGEGRYRLRLVVSGDKLTELAYFLKIPDAFSRRYEEMRSVNNAIGVGGSIAFLLLYGVGGMAVGLFFLVRQRWVLWRQPVFWGAVVALAQTAARVNEWPLAWMQYDTALSTRSFVAQQAALAVAELAAFVALFSLSFMAAESLTRRAFPSHPQFWRIWGREAGGSRAILGRTVAGFLLVPIFVAYEVALYFVATRWLGWWTPSEAQFNPDVLAAYAPWFSAIARSFQAGFWEEALFRAVPIAGAALIGDRFGNRRLWIVLAFIVQAVIFGAGHAPYPTQPAYARVVELVLPSIGFGLLYLVFGLLPAVILHFAFDVMWFAMPLFATTAAGIRLQQIIVVAAALAPLAVVLARRGTGQGGEVPLNAAWQPAPTVVTEPPPPAVASDAGLRPSLVKWLTVAGPLAAAVWMVAIGRLPVQRHTLQASRAEATHVARTALSSARLGPEWRFLPVAGELFGPPHRFVWTTAGQATYASLLGTYLNAPGWSVFVRTFEGDVAERVENWTVRLDADGAVQGISHELPESRAGTSLDEATARELAKREVVTRFGIDPSVLKDVAATPSQLPKRIDWTVTFSDTSHPLPTGELRLQVRLAGDEVAQARRFVFIPEDWERNERNAQTIASIVTGGGMLLAGVAMVAGLITAIISWSRRQFSVRVFLVVFASFLVFSAVRLANSFPTLMAQLSTAAAVATPTGGAPRLDHCRCDSPVRRDGACCRRGAVLVRRWPRLSASRGDARLLTGGRCRRRSRYQPAVCARANVAVVRGCLIVRSHCCRGDNPGHRAVHQDHVPPVDCRLRQPTVGALDAPPRARRRACRLHRRRVGQCSTAAESWIVDRFGRAHRPTAAARVRVRVAARRQRGSARRRGHDHRSDSTRGTCTGLPQCAARGLGCCCTCVDRRVSVVPGIGRLARRHRAWRNCHGLRREAASHN
jgi:hypothetical protein